MGDLNPFQGFVEREPISLSQARHDLHLMPKQFETNLEPILVEHQGKPALVIIAPELLSLLVSAMAYIEEKGLKEDYLSWAESQQDS